MKNWIINKIGCLIARWIIHNYEDGFVIKRQSGSRQIIKVFSEPAWKNVIKPTAYDVDKVVEKLEQMALDTSDTQIGIATRMAYGRVIEMIKSSANGKD